MEPNPLLVPHPQEGVATPPLELAVSPLHPDGTLVAMRGELCLATMDNAHERVNDLLAGGTPRLVLDLRELSFLDSTGIRLLLVLDERANSERFRFSLLVREDAEPSRALRLVGLQERPSRADALEVDSAAALASTAV